MSITVIITRDDNGAPTTREVYEAGAKFTNEGGDLAIISARPQLLALYGSGNWLSVHVDDFVEVVTTKPDEDSDDSDSFDFGSDDDASSDDTSSGDASSEDSSDSSELDALLADS